VSFQKIHQSAEIPSDQPQVNHLRSTSDQHRRAYCSFFNKKYTNLSCRIHTPAPLPRTPTKKAPQGVGGCLFKKFIKVQSGHQPQINLRSTSDQPQVNLRSTSGQPQVNLRSTSGQPQVNLRSTSGQHRRAYYSFFNKKYTNLSCRIHTPAPLPRTLTKKALYNGVGPVETQVQ